MYFCNILYWRHRDAGGERRGGVLPLPREGSSAGGLPAGTHAGKPVQLERGVACTADEGRQEQDLSGWAGDDCLSATMSNVHVMHERKPAGYQAGWLREVCGIIYIIYRTVVPLVNAKVIKYTVMYVRVMTCIITGWSVAPLVARVDEPSAQCWI